MHEVVFNVKIFFVDVILVEWELYCLKLCMYYSTHVCLGLCFNTLSHPPLSLSPSPSSTSLPPPSPGLPPLSLPLQGSLRSSHQISPQEFLGELKSGVMDERLLACLDSLRVSLTSNPVRYASRTQNSPL